MRIHAATSADLDLLAPLFGAYLRFYEVEKSAGEVREFLQQRLARGDSTVFIASDDDGSGLGFIQLYPLFASLMLQPSWLLSDLFVTPEARCRGVGEALMNRARDHALANGACGLQLETAKSNLAGQRLYERLGYVRDEVFYTYWLNLA